LGDEGLEVGDPDPQQRAHYGVGQHAAKPAPSTSGGERLGQTNQVDATAYRWLSIMRGGHSCVTQFPNKEDTQETAGYGRTPRCAGSGPSGPGFKSRAPNHLLNTILASRLVLGRAPDHSRYHNFPKKYQSRRCERCDRCHVRVLRRPSRARRLRPTREGEAHDHAR
jgi:hypothetical protein